MFSLIAVCLVVPHVETIQPKPKAATPVWFRIHDRSIYGYKNNFPPCELAPEISWQAFFLSANDVLPWLRWGGESCLITTNRVFILTSHSHCMSNFSFGNWCGREQVFSTGLQYKGPFLVVVFWPKIHPGQNSWLQFFILLKLNSD